MEDSASDEFVNIQKFIRTDGFFEELIKLVEPRYILEVGSWLGRSAITWFYHSESYDLGANIYCLDTWLGSTEHWLGVFKNGEWSKNHLNLDIKNEPHIFEQFIANVDKYQASKSIFPIRATSKTGLAYLKDEEISFDLIYVDGAHDFVSVFQDLIGSAALLRKGGFIACDDFQLFETRLAIFVFCLFSWRKIYRFQGSDRCVISREKLDGNWQRISKINLVVKFIKQATRNFLRKGRKNLL
jgi:hypothetical protein